MPFVNIRDAATSSFATSAYVIDQQPSTSRNIDILTPRRHHQSSASSPSSSSSSLFTPSTSSGSSSKSPKSPITSSSYPSLPSSSHSSSHHFASSPSSSSSPISTISHHVSNSPSLPTQNNNNISSISNISVSPPPNNVSNSSLSSSSSTSPSTAAANRPELELRALRSQIILRTFMFWFIRMVPIILLIIIVNGMKVMFVQTASTTFTLIDIALWLSFIFLLILSFTSVALNYCNALRIEAALAFEGLPSMSRNLASGRSSRLSGDIGDTNFEEISDCPLCLYMAPGESLSPSILQQFSALSSSVNWCAEHGKLVLDPPPEYESPPSYDEPMVIKTIAV